MERRSETMATVEIFLGEIRGDRPFANVSVPLVWVGQSWERDRLRLGAARDQPDGPLPRTESPYGDMPPTWFGASRVGGPSGRFPLLSRAQQYDVVEYHDAELGSLRLEIEDLKSYLLPVDALGWSSLSAVLRATDLVPDRRLVVDDV